MPDEKLLTFAYGSNMSTARLRERVPSAEPKRIGQLRSHALRWHKRSRDLSGKSDVVRTEADSDVVWGVIFEIDRAEKRNLDLAEGLGHGYDERDVEIVVDEEVMKCQMYFATDIDDSLLSYEWYKTYVVEGAREHGLPPGYIEKLEAVAAQRDPDEDRARRNSSNG